VKDSACTEDEGEGARDNARAEEGLRASDGGGARAALLLGHHG
jgi:hypothetical protein